MQISARILASETSAAATPLLDHLSLVLAAREMVTNQIMIFTVLGISKQRSIRATTLKRSPWHKRGELPPPHPSSAEEYRPPRRQQKRLHDKSLVAQQKLNYSCHHVNYSIHMDETHRDCDITADCNASWSIKRDVSSGDGKANVVVCLHHVQWSAGSPACWAVTFLPKVWQSHVPCFGPEIVVPRPGAMRAAAIRLPGQLAVNWKRCCAYHRHVPDSEDHGCLSRLAFAMVDQ